MPAILSKLRDDLVTRASNVQPGVALGVGAGIALAACALYTARDKAPFKSLNNNDYKPAQNGKSKSARCKLGARCGKEDCALCGGEVQTDNRQTIDTDSEDGSSTGDPEEMVGLNLNFIKQLISLTRIMVPSVRSREMGILAVHTVCLFTRTFLSIYVASLEGSMVKHIVKKDIRNFALMLMQWFGIAIPATFINSMIRFLESKLALAFRTRLVTHAYDLYFKNQTYYRVGNLDGRIENADHRLTEDVSVFAASFAHLYGQLTKPCFDLLLIALTLARYTSNMRANIFVGPALASLVILSTGQTLRVLSPQFGALAGEQARRAARLRHAHSRLIAHAEEVAFYGGHRVELSQLQTAYGSLASQMSDVFKVKLWYIMLEQFFMKYVWSGTGMVMLALPILTGGSRRGEIDGVSSRTEYLTTSRNLLNSAADAIERLLSSYKEVTTLAGYASRVADMLAVFSEVAEGKCVRSSHVQQGSSFSSFRVKFRDGQPVIEGKIIYTPSLSIRLRDVPIVTPGCDVVASGVNLDLEPGEHLLITGPNGCGKSSLFRIISGLWPVYAGTLEVPLTCSCQYCATEPAPRQEKSRDTKGRCDKRPIMFYIPQRPYMSMGTLLDQITYPLRFTGSEAKEAASKAIGILRLVNLEAAAARHGGLNATTDWNNTLSGGEKQRLAMARMFFHRPVYALLDECTSAVSMETECIMYEEAVSQGITLLSITHRPSVWKYHKNVLEFDGQGNWSFRSLNLNERSQTTTKLAAIEEKPNDMLPDVKSDDDVSISSV